MCPRWERRPIQDIGRYRDTVNHDPSVLTNAGLTMDRMIHFNYRSEQPFRKMRAHCFARTAISF
jgi:hypothetical protein